MRTSTETIMSIEDLILKKVFQNKLLNPGKPTEILIVSGNRSLFLVWKKPNKLEFYQEDKEKRKYQLPKKEKIKDIVSSFQTYQILTESGKIWSLANKNRNKEVALLDAGQSTFEEIRSVTFFEE
ncbi:hypothetical protein M0813_22727 [Anaeramoeba flamelloides]|uniref:Uncharacterized protein n=1 Tax=Anaeramoeba flamelloides TaxID=1746091 RepID=A0ABQ8YCG6_9EUKA|nr:hypothetical protein M0813_22727 [Anaeramoeba flamelloides]